MRKDEFIFKSNMAHGNKYIYDKVPNEFKSSDKITIVCPIHGEFIQCARYHYRGNGCPKCGKLRVNESNFKTAESRRLSRDEVINRANKVHNFKYCYDKYNGEKLSELTTIICPIHGEFKQTMRKHLMGSGCRKCGYEKLREIQKRPIDSIIKECEAVHNHKYKYVLDFEYINNKSYLHAICPIHGDFMQEINAHLHGQGCPKCGVEETANKLRKGKEYMVNKAIEVHGDKYFYDKFEYINWHTKGVVTCPIHGDFMVSASNHITNGSGCPRCNHLVSRWEQEIYDFIISLGIECEQSNRNILNGKEIDIFIPKYSIGIECDGLRWHNEQYRDKNYHLLKTNECNERGIRLIHIFEDEWIFKKEIWQSMFRNMFGLIENKVYARKCEVREVIPKDVRLFLNTNHIQGYSNSKYNYGLYYNGELVSLMTFGIPRINMGGKKEDSSYELVRFCNKLNTNVVGGASKLFNYFIKQFSPNSIVSYSDKRWSLGKLYRILGFIHTHDSKPNYYYVNGINRLNRFGFRKSILISEGYDKNKSEHEIMNDRGIYRIYDCGTMVWKWKKIKD